MAKKKAKAKTAKASKAKAPKAKASKAKLKTNAKATPAKPKKVGKLKAAIKSAKKSVIKSVKKVVKKAVKTTASKKSGKTTVKKASKTVASPATKKSAAKPTNTKMATKAQKATPAKAAVRVTARPKLSQAQMRDLLRPLDDRILVSPTEKKERLTAGGLYIPDTVTEVSGYYRAVVLAIGRGHRNAKGKVKPMDVNVGDEIIFEQFAGTDIDVQGEKLMILRESDVLGITRK